MKFYLIRHGQTPWNIEGKIQGKTDIPLNETGIRQARLVAKAMVKRVAASGGGTPAIYCSVLKRAAETAEIVAAALAEAAGAAAVSGAEDLNSGAASLPGRAESESPAAGRQSAFTAAQPVHRLESLREVDFGLWEGHSWEEVRARWPAEFRRWEENPAEGTPTGGESRQSCEARSRDAVEQILREAEGDVILVAHGAILVYVADYLLRHQREKQEIIVTNASISTVEYQRETGMGRMLCQNDTSHLGPWQRFPTF